MDSAWKSPSRQVGATWTYNPQAKACALRFRSNGCIESAPLGSSRGSIAISPAGFGYDANVSQTLELDRVVERSEAREVNTGSKLLRQRPANLSVVVLMQRRTEADAAAARRVCREAAGEK